MAKKLVTDLDVAGKKVIVRVDFNVPIKDGIILDDNRIKQSLETINYCLEHNAKIILLSHLGRIKTSEDKIKNTRQLDQYNLSLSCCSFSSYYLTSTLYLYYNLN